jgi:hypothetical protein
MRAKRTHCKRGHPFDEKNSYIRSDGSRRCRKCHALAVFRYDYPERYAAQLRAQEAEALAHRARADGRAKLEDTLRRFRARQAACSERGVRWLRWQSYITPVEQALEAASS